MLNVSELIHVVLCSVRCVAETYEGIPAIVVAYYFERILLHEILKDNAG